MLLKNRDIYIRQFRLVEVFNFKIQVSTPLNLTVSSVVTLNVVKRLLLNYTILIYQIYFQYSSKLLLIFYISSHWPVEKCFHQDKKMSKMFFLPLSQTDLSWLQKHHQNTI